eukprot:205086-Prymnesium_polylepis.1
MRANYNDGASEEVVADEIAVNNFSPNVLFIPPGGADTHTGAPDLFMYNNDTNRYMLTVTKSAITECIETTVTTSYTRCSTTVATGLPVILVKMPGVLGIKFNISADGGGGTYNGKKLTPTNGAARLAPFDSYTTTVSDFVLEVFFDDGTSVNTFASEVDSSITTVLYISDDLTCATVDNDANTVTIVEGAMCDV